MRTVLKGTAIAALAVAGLVAGQGVADENATLVIEGEEMVTRAATPEWHPLPETLSGWLFRSEATQQLETDDFENPAFAAISLAEEMWETPAGTSDQSCADCHGAIEDSMAGVRAGMPKWNEAAGEPWALEDYINHSVVEHQGAEAWKWESEEMLAMTAYIGLQSRGMPVDVQIDGPMEDWWKRGEELYYTRVGQLDLSCAHCHEYNYGNMIRADHLSQGNINGFPVYRLKWGGLGSIHRRFKGCMDQVRATPYKRGSDEFTALELYLASRGAGLSVETPAVRN